MICLFMMGNFMLYHEAVHALICHNLEGRESTFSFKLWPPVVQQHCGNDVGMSPKAIELNLFNEIIGYSVGMGMAGLMIAGYFIAMYLKH